MRQEGSVPCHQLQDRGLCRRGQQHDQGGHTASATTSSANVSSAGETLTAEYPLFISHAAAAHLCCLRRHFVCHGQCLYCASCWGTPCCEIVCSIRRVMNATSLSIAGEGCGCHPGLCRRPIPGEGPGLPSSGRLHSVHRLHGRCLPSTSCLTTPL